MSSFSLATRGDEAAASDDIHAGCIGDPRKRRHYFSRATPSSTGSCAADTGRLTVCWVGREVSAPRASECRRRPRTAPMQAYSNGENRGLPTFADSDDVVGAGLRSDRARARAARVRSTAVGNPDRSPVARSHVSRCIWESLRGRRPGVAFGWRSAEQDVAGSAWRRSLSTSRCTLCEQADPRGGVGAGRATEIPRSTAICASVSCRLRHTRVAHLDLSARWCCGVAVDALQGGHLPCVPTLVLQTVRSYWK